MGALGQPDAGRGAGRLVVREPPAHRPRCPDVADTPGARRRDRHTSHRVRNGLLAGAAALAVLGAGIGIGHATLGNTPSTQAFSPTSGSTPHAIGLRLRRRERLGWLGLLG